MPIYIGITDRYNKPLYEGCTVKDYHGTGVVEYVASKAAYRVNYFDSTRAKWFIDYLDYEFDGIEIIEEEL